MARRIFCFPLNGSDKAPVLKSTLDGCRYFIEVTTTDTATIPEIESMTVERGPASSFTIGLNTDDFSCVESKLLGRGALWLSKTYLTSLLPEYDWLNGAVTRSPKPIEWLKWHDPENAGYIQWSRGATGIDLVFCETFLSPDGAVRHNPICKYCAANTIIHIYDESGPSLFCRRRPRLVMIGGVCHVSVPASYVAGRLIGLSKD